jgi:hypothetical protein
MNTLEKLRGLAIDPAHSLRLVDWARSIKFYYGLAKRKYDKAQEW